MGRKFSKHVRWTQKEEKIIVDMYEKAKSINDLCNLLPSRSKSQIFCKASFLGLKRPIVIKISAEERLKRKRESMARKRRDDPEKAREYSNNYHSKNRDKQCLKMREYSRRRFFWTKATKLRKKGKANFKEIASLWKRQKGQCALTGRRLDRSAQLDHILPKARGGSDSIENLQWVCEEANIAKRRMTDDEFIVLCGDVMKWIGERIQLVEDMI